MCGIVGYAGSRQAAPILLDGMTRLEYRGYDSAGVGVHGTRGFEIAKAKGRLQVLKEKTGDGAALCGTVGIGHTRWATHGAPSDINSHPHLSNSKKIAVVHNGVIENEARLRQWLREKGVEFYSETDTEVVANLIGLYYAESGDLPGAVRQTLEMLQGSYALGILCTDLPDTVVAVKKDSPLIFGFGDGEHFIASDVPAILKHTQTVAYMDDGEMAVFTGSHAAFFDADGKPIEKKREHITWGQSDAERGSYAHFMLKEIMEQPKAVADTVRPRIRDGKVVLEGVDLSAAYLKGLKKIYLVACGSAYYASVLAKYHFEEICRIPTEALMASEFRYGHPVVDESNLVIILSQSGETADTLAALREAKRLGARTLAIVNVVGSAIAKAADQVIYTWAGPEIAVAATKAFTTQLSVVHLLALYMAHGLKTMDDATYAQYVQAMAHLPEDMHRLLCPENVQKIRDFAKRYSGRHDAFFIGRNLDSAVCLEGSMKLKEVAYVHSEAYAAGELKHGPISLIEPGTFVVALATVKPIFNKTMSNIQGVRARGADVLCITLEQFAQEAQKQADSLLCVPEVLPMLQPALNVIPLQLLAYYIALERGCDVDRPRNLAKSVTVE